MLGGAVVGYVEFLRPGTVVAGVCGMVLLMLGVARLSELPWSGWGALVLLAGLAAMLVWRGSVWGVPLLFLGARWLIGPEELRVRWVFAAALALPFGLLTAWLLAIAEQARLNKAAF
jgi:membrane-bound ClpP family serine protease